LEDKVFPAPNQRLHLLLVLAAALALSTAACSGSSAPSSPSGEGGGAIQTGSGLSGAAAALSGIDSYQFTETLANNSGASDSPATYTATIRGTVVNGSPPSADLDLAGNHYIVVGNRSWEWDNGVWVSTPLTFDDFKNSLDLPPGLYGTIVEPFSSRLAATGEETHDGVACVRYASTGSATATVALPGSNPGLVELTRANVWIAQNGGYPVSVSIEIVGSDQRYLQATFDMVHVNDPDNIVAVPSGV
jgi:hypothetical protein